MISEELLIVYLHLDVTMETDDQIPDKCGHDGELVTAVLSSGDGTSETSSVPSDSNRTDVSMETSQPENTNHQSVDETAVSNEAEGEASEAKTAGEFDKQLEQLLEVRAAVKFDTEEEGELSKVKEAADLQSDDVTHEQRFDSSNETTVQSTVVDHVSSMDTKVLTPEQPKCDDLTSVTLESDGDDLLTELDRELTGKDPNPVSIDCEKRYSEHPPSLELSDSMKTSTDVSNLPAYREIKQQNEELTKEQERMKLEIER